MFFLIPNHQPTLTSVYNGTYCSIHTIISYKLTLNGNQPKAANLTVPVTSGRGGRSSHSPSEDVELPLSRKISASFLTAGLTTERCVTALLRFLELEEPPIVQRLCSSFIQQEGVVVKWAWRTYYARI